MNSFVVLNDWLDILVGIPIIALIYLVILSKKLNQLAAGTVISEYS